jgi:maltose-binding protein MalE
MPNIPQMANVWQDLGAAWVRSTKGAGAVPARRSFLGAQRSIAQKIG